MKRILIIGKTSYIGTSFKEWMKKHPQYTIEMISARGDNWKNKKFSSYDTILYVAGIAHRRETKKNKQLYFDVNYTLTRNIADKAKSEGVRHFVYLSSMSVYGMDVGEVNNETSLNPTSFYGKSKLQAENYLITLQNKKFLVSIIRPPMVYGKNCKGNYQLLSRFANKSKVFFETNNQRSMIYIDNLSHFIFIVIHNSLEGIFMPQNESYVSTDMMVKKISEINNKKIYLVPKTSNLIGQLTSYSKLLRKVCGSLIYLPTTDGFPGTNYKKIKLDYQDVDFSESIKKTEK